MKPSLSVVDMAGCITAAIFEQNQELLQVTAQDREIKEGSAEPGASAVQLFFINASSAGCQVIGISRKFRVMRKGRFGSATGNRTRVLRLRISRPNP